VIVEGSTGRGKGTKKQEEFQETARDAVADFQTSISASFKHGNTSIIIAGNGSRRRRRISSSSVNIDVYAGR
jgi:hypothetical protein